MSDIWYREHVDLPEEAWRLRAWDGDKCRTVGAVLTHDDTPRGWVFGVDPAGYGPTFFVAYERLYEVDLRGAPPR